jgi:cell division protein ZapA
LKDKNQKGGYTMDKQYTEVMIGGNIYRLSGVENEEYLQQVAIYLNSKLKELRQTDGFSRLPADYQNLMVQMNVADDYFKAKERAAKLNQKLEEMEKELYQVKHDLITNQLKMESMQKGLMDADQLGGPELFVLNRRTDD